VGQGGEILHVRAEDNRAIRDDGLDRVLATVGRQAFADEDDGGDGVPVAQFAGGIEQKTVDGGGSAGFTSSRQGDAEGAQLPGDFSRALDVARRDEEEEIREFVAQLAINFREDFFFDRVRAAAEQYRASRINPQCPEDGAGNVWAERDIVRIELDAADPPEASAVHA